MPWSTKKPTSPRDCRMADNASTTDSFYKAFIGF
jgi:hypothetical protein